MKALVYTDVKTLKYKDVQNPKLKKMKRLLRSKLQGFVVLICMHIKVWIA